MVMALYDTHVNPFLHCKTIIICYSRSNVNDIIERKLSLPKCQYHEKKRLFVTSTTQLANKNNN